LRRAAEAMNKHAQAPMPKGLNNSQKNSLLARRRKLKAQSDAVMKSAAQADKLGDKTQGKLLTLADAESFSGSLNTMIKQVEKQQEDLRNKRQMTQTTFQNFDQKTNQLYNTLSNVVKSMNETRKSILKKML